MPYVCAFHEQVLLQVVRVLLQVVRVLLKVVRVLLQVVRVLSEESWNELILIWKTFFIEISTYFQHNQIDIGAGREE
jgi:hypothetical protein